MPGRTPPSPWTTSTRKAELKEKSGPYIFKLMERGVLALAAGPTVIRFLPPLVIEQEDLDRVADLTAEVLK